MKILITAGKTALALKLVKGFNNDEIILADYGEMPLLNSKNYNLISLGDKNLDITAHTLLNNCLNESVDTILPLQTFEIDAVSKSTVLFSEFGIQVLLPELSELDKYLNTETSKENWIIFNDGIAVFYTSKNEAVMKLGQSENLTGAFYFDDVQNPILKLITI